MNNIVCNMQGQFLFCKVIHHKYTDIFRVYNYYYLSSRTHPRVGEREKKKTADLYFKHGKKKKNPHTLREKVKFNHAAPIQDILHDMCATLMIKQ